MQFSRTSQSGGGVEGGGGSQAASGRQGKHSILQLPLVPLASRLTQQLLPDPLTPTPSALISVEASAPSLLRRSRGVGEGAHFAYTTPLVLPFPYDLPKVGDEEQQEGESHQGSGDREAEQKRVASMSPQERQKYGMEKARVEMERVERLMRRYEVAPDNVEATVEASGSQDEHVQGYLPRGRAAQTYPSARLLGISPACIRDCLPELDVGDALDWIDSKSGKDSPDCYSSGPLAPTPGKVDEAARPRYEMSDYLSGRLLGAIFPTGLDDEAIEVDAARGVAEAQHRRVVRGRQARKDAGKSENEDEEEESQADRWTRRSALLRKRAKQLPREYAGYAPWSNSYSGHQFGQWAGQLGDGRAVSLLETQNSRGQRWEIQLKGAGRTPFSRFADGLATLASSVREFLASEALAALGIPTSRALCVIAIKDVPVLRETRSAAAITTRLAPIWTRVGSFEHHAVRNEWESVRLLGEFVCREGYGWQEISPPQASDSTCPPWATRLVRECALRNAHTVALWQAYGFMHGVMNTDNISLLGLTIDFGPFAFMDTFDRYAVSNKSDGEARYSYHMQPTAALFVMEQLVESLGLLIGFEHREARAARPGELVQLDEATRNELRRQGKEQVWPEIKELFMDSLLSKWEDAWRRRLALHDARRGDRAELIDPLMDILEGYLDMSVSLRRLECIKEHIDLMQAPSAETIDAMADAWLDWESIPSYVREPRRADTVRWLENYITRLREEGRQSAEKVVHDLRSANPAFILRNWVTNDVVHRLEQSDDTQYLARVLNMCADPFASWGEDQLPHKSQNEKEEEQVRPDWASDWRRKTAI